MDQPAAPLSSTALPTPTAVASTGETLRAPFPYFGGKRGIASLVWRAFGPRVKHYIEPFMGSLAVLLAAPYKPSLEVVNDMSFYLANFWRAVRHQPDEVARWADYPVSHIDLAARHKWLTQSDRLRATAERLSDPEWEGDAKFAGWWLWGQCAWIGSGWCERESKIPHVSDAGQGVHSKIPHVSDAGRGVHSQIPHVSDAGQPTRQGAEPWEAIDLPDRGEHIRRRMRALSRRLQDVRIVHGDWARCLNSHYGGGGDRVGVFLDPPYRAYEALYGIGADASVAGAVEAWALENADARVVLCGHLGDYPTLDAAGCDCVPWKPQRRMAPWVPLPMVRAWASMRWPGRKWGARRKVPGGRAAPGETGKPATRCLGATPQARKRRSWAGWQARLLRVPSPMFCTSAGPCATVSRAWQWSRCRTVAGCRTPHASQNGSIPRLYARTPVRRSVCVGVGVGAGAMVGVAVLVDAAADARRFRHRPSSDIPQAQFPRAPGLSNVCRGGRQGGVAG